MTTPTSEPSVTVNLTSERRTSEHRIDDRGEKILCSAAEEAPCRSRPACDTELFYADGCVEHKPKHPVTPDHACWQSENVNACSLEESSVNWSWHSEPHIIPGAEVVMENDEDGTRWDYLTA